MYPDVRTGSKVGAAVVGAISVAAMTAATLVGQYSMTVNRDRLVNAQNEPQNWLMMNGDYASTRYSKLTQINRENVKDLRMVWALALGGMQDVGQNGPESEVNPLIDNGFMYTTDGWGTLYKIDARAAEQGRARMGDRSGSQARGQHPAHARHRALGRPGDREPARRPRHRSEPRERRDRVGQEGRRHQRVRQPREILYGADHGRRQGHHRERRRRRTNARLDRGARCAHRQTSCGAGTWCRSRAIRAARRGRTRTTRGRPAAAASGRPVPTIRPRGSRSGAPATRFPHTIRRRVPATTSTPTPWSP